MRQLSAFTSPGGEKDALQRRVYLAGDHPFLVWRKSVGSPISESHGGCAIGRANIGTVVFAATLARFKKKQRLAI